MTNVCVNTCVERKKILSRTFAYQKMECKAAVKIFLKRGGLCYSATQLSPHPNLYFLDVMEYFALSTHWNHYRGLQTTFCHFLNLKNLLYCKSGFTILSIFVQFEMLEIFADPPRQVRLAQTSQFYRKYSKCTKIAFFRIFLAN